MLLRRFLRGSRARPGVHVTILANSIGYVFLCTCAIYECGLQISVSELVPFLRETCGHCVCWDVSGSFPVPQRLVLAGGLLAGCLTGCFVARYMGYGFRVARGKTVTSDIGLLARNA
jgi:hypothetical protein